MAAPILLELLIALTSGARLGPYEILSALGAGGMGEVYRAKDTKLHRDVAIKVLPDSLADNPDRLARFQREAQLLASLNHPNIGGIYGLEDTDGVRALVLELIEGPTLADRIAQGPIPLDEALPIARQIAEALEAAHEHGIIHRDLKPANIKVRPDGTVKVLDFGLAKAMDGVSTEGTGPRAGGAGAFTQSPTISPPAAMTAAGMILGTAAYMAPEQAKGKPLDKRTDIWAFGCVLFEMLTGKRAFGGDDVSDTLASILRSEPDWAALPAAAPPAIRRLLRRCLEKDSRGRLHDIADARIEISATPADWDDQPRHVSSAPGRSRERLAWMAAGVLGLATLAGGITTVLRLREPAPLAAPVAFTVTPPDGTTFITPQSTGLPWLAVSPDGRTLAFVALSADGRQQLWLRSLAAAAVRPLAGTDDARAPFWSPDSRFVAFFAQGKLKYVEATGGTPQVLADAPYGSGGSWGGDNIILFNRGSGEGLEKVSFGGNRVAVPVTRVDASKGQRGHYWPEFLPDGRHFLFAVARSSQTDTWIGSVDGDAPRFLFSSTANARYAPPGYLLYPAGGALMARRFDADAMLFAGDPFKLADASVGQQPTAYAALSTSATGVLAYGISPVSDPQLVWMDRSGRRIGPVLLPGATDPALSPDGTVLAMTRNLPQTGTGIWLLDLKRDSPRRLTLDAAAASAPLWSPDGKYVAFRSRKGDRLDVLYRTLANGSGSEELILDMEGSIPTDWSDERFILFHSLFGDSGADLWVLPLGDLKAKRLVSTPFTEVQGVLSPDLQWLAYASNESGVMEVYVQPFPPTGVKTPVSRGGGAEPRWRSDGRELFYVSADRRLMAVPTKVTPTFEAATPEPLFEMNIRDLTRPFSQRRYQPSPDGQRFLVVEQSRARAEVLPITVLVNWPATLQK